MTRYKDWSSWTSRACALKATPSARSCSAAYVGPITSLDYRPVLCRICALLLRGCRGALPLPAPRPTPELCTIGTSAGVPTIHHEPAGALSHLAAATQLSRCGLPPPCWPRGALGPQGPPRCSCAPLPSRYRFHHLACACRAGWVHVGSIPADLRCCGGVFVEAPPPGASQRHPELAISGFSSVNPMESELISLKRMPRDRVQWTWQHTGTPGAGPAPAQVPPKSSALALPAGCRPGASPPLPRQAGPDPGLCEDRSTKPAPIVTVHGGHMAGSIIKFARVNAENTTKSQSSYTSPLGTGMSTGFLARKQLMKIQYSMGLSTQPWRRPSSNTTVGPLTPFQVVHAVALFSHSWIMCHMAPLTPIEYRVR